MSFTTGGRKMKDINKIKLDFILSGIGKDKTRPMFLFPFWDAENKRLLSTDGWQMHCWTMDDHTINKYNLPSNSTTVIIDKTKNAIYPIQDKTEYTLQDRIGVMQNLLLRNYTTQPYIFKGDPDEAIPDLLFFANETINLKFLINLQPKSISWGVAIHSWITTEKYHHAILKFNGLNEYDDLLAIVASREGNRTKFVEEKSNESNEGVEK